jgi:hypothetical protein
MSIQATIIVTAVVLLFTHGYYLNERLRDVHKKLDTVLDEFNGLREYLYEIDPQFDDERESLARVFADAPPLFSGMDDMELLKKKKEAGKRTLNTRFSGNPII